MTALSSAVDIETGARQVFERQRPSGVRDLASSAGQEISPITRIDSVPSQREDPSAQAAATFIDGSDPLFSMYNEMTAEHDRKAAENWRSDADSAVIVNGLFSVMVAILLGMSYQNASIFYLSQIYQVQLLGGLNGTSTSPLSQTSDPSAFSFSVWTSTSWSVSLVISLICTVIATLLRQWARRYLQITQDPRGVRNRARVCEFVAQGVEIKQLRRMSSVLLGFFHLSVGLFLSGFVYSINSSVAFWVTLGFTVICVGLYCFISVAPLVPRCHIAHTPFSSFFWFYWSRFVWLTYALLYNSSRRLPFITYRTQRHLLELARTHLVWTLRDTKVAIEDLARKCSSSLDASVLSRVFDSLDGHKDIEQFLFAIFGFYNSGEVNKHSSVLEGLNDRILAPAIASFMDRSLSSNLLTNPEKQQGITICLQAMQANPLLLQCTFGRTLRTLKSEIFRRSDFVSLAFEQLRRDDADPWVKDYAQCIVAVAINRADLDNGAWIDIARAYLKPEHAHYQWEGHNLRLCSVIYLIQHLKDSQLESSDQFKQGGVWCNVLAEALKVNLMDTASGLQHEFCVLLDELSRSMAPGASEMAQSNAGLILSSIRTAFPSSKGDQGPVLRWLAGHPPHEVATRAELDVIPSIGTIEIDHPRDTVLEQHHELRSPSPHYDLPPFSPPYVAPSSPISHANTEAPIAPNPGERPDFLSFEPGLPDPTDISQFELVREPSRLITQLFHKNRPSPGTISEWHSSENTPVDRARSISVDPASRPPSSASTPYRQSVVLPQGLPRPDSQMSFADPSSDPYRSHYIYRRPSFASGSSGSAGVADGPPLGSTRSLNRMSSSFSVPDISIQAPSRSQSQTPQATPVISHRAFLSAEDAANRPISPTTPTTVLATPSSPKIPSVPHGILNLGGAPKISSLPDGQLPHGFVPFSVSSPSQPLPSRTTSVSAHSKLAGPPSAVVASPKLPTQRDPRSLHGVPVPDASSSSGRRDSLYKSVRIPLSSTTAGPSVMVPPPSIFSQPPESSSSETTEDEAVASSIASSKGTFTTPPPSRKRAKAKRPKYDAAPRPPGQEHPTTPLMRGGTLASSRPETTSTGEGHSGSAGMTPMARPRSRSL